MLNSISTLNVLMKEQPGKYKTIDGIMDIKAYYGFAFRKDDDRLVKIANDMLTEMKTSGELAKLQTKWFGTTMDSPNEIPAVLP